MIDTQGAECYKKTIRLYQTVEASQESSIPLRIKEDDNLEWKVPIRWGRHDVIS